MTARDLLGQLRQLPAVVRLDRGGGVVVTAHNSSQLTGALRAAVTDAKPELVTILKGEAANRRKVVDDAFAGVFARVGAALGAHESLAWPVIAQVWPATARGIDYAETKANAEAVKYRHAERHLAVDFLAAVEAFETAWLQGVSYITSGCHACGAMAVTVIIQDDQGSRLCRKCWRSPATKGGRT